MNGVKANQRPCRTPFSPWDIRFPHWVGRMWCCRSFSLVPGLPSRLSAVGCPSLFEPFIGTSPESDSWPACLWVVRLSPSPTGLPLTTATEADQVSRFSCMMFLDAHGVSDCAGSCGGIVIASLLVLPSPSVIGWAPWIKFSFTAQYPARPSPVYASTPASRLTLQNSGPGWVTTPFL